MTIQRVTDKLLGYGQKKKKRGDIIDSATENSFIWIDAELNQGTEYYAVAETKSILFG